MTLGGDKLYLREVAVTIVGKGGEVEVDGFRIAFEVEKSNESNPNRSKVRIYNLSDKTRSLFEDTGGRIILKAGYRDNYGVIFSGNITKAKHKKRSKTPQKRAVTRIVEGVDIITEIECGDGDNRYRNAVWHKGYPPGTTVRQVVADLSKQFGLPTAIEETAIPSLQYANGFATEGYIRNVLTDICRTHNLEWSIQNEVLQITSKKLSNMFGAVILSPDTGLVGSPTKTDQGIEFESLLQPGLIPGRNVQLESQYIKGLFKVRKVKHVGDSYEGDFKSICEATKG